MLISLPKRHRRRTPEPLTLLNPQWLHDLDALVARGKLDELPEALEPSLFLFCAGHPLDSDSPIAWGKALEMFPGFGLHSELVGKISGQPRGHGWGFPPRPRAECLETCRSHLSFGNQFLGSLDI